MYFIIFFLRKSIKNDSIMVVVDRLINLTYLIPLNTTYLASDVA